MLEVDMDTEAEVLTRHPDEAWLSRKVLAVITSPDWARYQRERAQRAIRFVRSMGTL